MADKRIENTKTRIERYYNALTGREGEEIEKKEWRGEDRER